jgi:hypothetical protein
MSDLYFDTLRSPQDRFGAFLRRNVLRNCAMITQRPPKRRLQIGNKVRHCALGAPGASAAFGSGAGLSDSY